MAREWQRNQQINFSHNNEEFLKPTPRQVREITGASLAPDPVDVSVIGDHLVGAAVYIFIGYVLAHSFI